MKNLLIISIFTLVAGCGSKQSTTTPDGQNKAECQSISANGIATFSKIEAVPGPWGRTAVSFTWTGADGTVFDMNTYTMTTSNYCISDEKLTVGETTAVNAWVQCPNRPAQLQAQAVVPYLFGFPDLKSSHCDWNF